MFDGRLRSVCVPGPIRKRELVLCADELRAGMKEREVMDETRLEASGRKRVGYRSWRSAIGVRAGATVSFSL